MAGRDPMKGRHNVGVQRVSTGKTKSGQSEPASNKFKTASSYNTTPKPPVQANQAKTSLDLTKRLQGKAPQPFTNTQGAATSPTPASPRGAKPGGESVANPRGVYAGKSGSTVTARALPNAGAVGYKGGTSPIGGNNQVISGRFGKQLPRKAGSQNLSSVKRNASFYGE